MSIKLEAQLRTVVGKKCRSLRAKNIIPGQIYNVKHNTNVQFDKKELGNVLKKVGTTSLVELKVGEKVYNSLVKEAQYSLDRQKIIYVDFYEVNMKKKVTTNVPIRIVGTSTLIEEKGAVLVLGVKNIDIEALPTQIPEFIEADVSTLETFSDSIKASDIILSSGVSLIGNPDVMIATCTEIRAIRQEEQEESDDVVENEQEDSDDKKIENDGQ